MKFETVICKHNNKITHNRFYDPTALKAYVGKLVTLKTKESKGEFEYYCFLHQVMVISPGVGIAQFLNLNHCKNGDPEIISMDTDSISSVKE
ncbi:MAG: hypothetical protein MJA82_15165 [Clostridia bacterium]|nr:hypothetical protein [Clostridia bacterium]